MGLRVRPLTLRQANEIVNNLHRHHKPVQGHRFSIGAFNGEECVGACIVGRPVSRMIDQYSVAEVTRLVTNGHKNACSMLYSAAARACQAMGFEKIQTYILAEEPGTSLIAAGWQCEGEAGGGDWNRGTRGGRRTDQPMSKKLRFAKCLTVRI